MPSIDSASASTMDVNIAPTFLSQFLDAEDFDASSEEHIICLFEVLGEVRGPNIVCQINYVMEAIIKTLVSSFVLDHIQMACKKLVVGIAEYVIHPLTEEEKKRERLHSLCMPLSKCLLGTQEGLVYGSALCLEALVVSASWSFASDDMVNDVCLRVAVALEEKPTQTSAHMRLAMVLAKRNVFIVEPYTRSMLRSGLQILNAGKEVDDHEKQLSAIQMVNILMKCVDSRSVFSELGVVIKELKKCYSNSVVRDAAIETIETARMLTREKRSEFEELGSSTDSNFVIRSNCRNKTVGGRRDRSAVPASPDPQYVYSPNECDFSANSLGSQKQLTSNLKCSGSSVKRKLWKEEGGVLTNGFDSFVGLTSNGLKTDSHVFKVGEVNNNEVDDVMLSGFMNSNPRRKASGSTTSSSERRQSELDVGDAGSVIDRRVSKKQVKMIRRPSSNHLQQNLGWEQYGNQNLVICANENSERPAQTVGSYSVSSTTEKAGSSDSRISCKLGTDEQQREKKEAPGKVGLTLVLAISLIILAVFLSYAWIDDQSERHFFPT